MVFGSLASDHSSATLYNPDTAEVAVILNLANIFDAVDAFIAKMNETLSEENQILGVRWE